MLAAFKSEARKLLSVRSTYIILLVSLALSMLFSFYAVGWQTMEQDFSNPEFLSAQTMGAVSILGLIVGVVAILLVTHEYRHNTIVYTITANKSRTTVFLSKFLVVTLFSVAFALVYGLLSPLLAYLVIHLRGFELVAQEINYWNLLWSSALVGWGYGAFAFIIASIIRIQVGAIAIMFLMPSTIEQLLGILLKKNQVYLPYSAVSNVFDFPGAGGNVISPTRAALVVGLYIAVGGTVALLLFLRRDAN